MKKHYLLIIALIISLLFGTYTFITQQLQRQSANLHTAMSILPYTSYDNVKNKINALSSLYMSITLHTTPQSTNRLIAFTKKEQAILMCLHYISVNPNDNKNWESLSKIAEDIGY